MYHTDPAIPSRQFVRNGNRLRVFIENDQATLFSQSGQNQARMTATTERAIHIYAV